MGFQWLLSVFLLVGLASNFAAGCCLSHCLKCPPLWTLYDGHCYRFFGIRKTFHEAESHCQQFTEGGEGHLVSIACEEEDDLMFEMWESLTMSPTATSDLNSVWLGLTDASNEGQFVWIDRATVSYTDWGDDEPNDWGNGEDCTTLRFHATKGRFWNDKPCSTELPYICKMTATS
ncbi:alpha-N-acetylgalactosamine-specific lectin-like [Acanthaster planci]|uniref:Alpha-N-acetylgalactosamine-specific lectin-like n=1 Tax=Acanthaster planci TaxID=133434 RepID=A0A8B7ZT75_ACAPL|nr:alpha-N-acetylgalactosamine-specific lectin-like [Acanthaster planci]